MVNHMTAPTKTLIRSVWTFDHDAATGNVAANVQRVFSLTDGGQTYTLPPAMDMVTAVEASSIFPEAGLLIEIATLRAERDAAVTAKNAAEAQVAALTAAQAQAA